MSILGAERASEQVFDAHRLGMCERSHKVDRTFASDYRYIRDVDPAPGSR